MKPLCFVLMPFGCKPGPSGQMIDFNAVYEQIIKPAIEQAGMEPLRADEEFAGGIIHKPMFERLVLCDYAVADLTSANANVFYELGVRHAVRKHASVLMFAEGCALPFDVAMLRALPYRLDKDGLPAAAPTDVTALLDRLVAARQSTTDSPLYQLLTDYPDVQHEKTDVFRTRVDYANGLKQELTQARQSGELDQVQAIEARLAQKFGGHNGAGLQDVEAGILIDLFLSYRALEGWSDMIALAGKFPAPLASTALVREQLAFALNRAKHGLQAETILKELIEQQGASSERCGLLGRVYKDQWRQARKDGKQGLAGGLLDKAIDAYRQGFEADWRDTFPGINLVTLLTCRAPDDPECATVLPVVRYAALRRADRTSADYWDFATLLEAAVLAGDRSAAITWLGKALASVRETWEPKTTLGNLKLIEEARLAHGINCAWMADIAAELEAAAPVAR